MLPIQEGPEAGIEHFFTSQLAVQVALGGKAVIVSQEEVRYAGADVSMY